MNLILLAIFTISSLFASEKYLLTHDAYMAPHTLKDTKLYYSENGFEVEQNGNKHIIQKCWMDPELRKISKKQLNGFLGKGYLALNKLDNSDEFTLKAKVRGIGGGPIGATVGATVGGGIVQGTYHALLWGIGAGLSPFITPMGAAGVVGTIRWLTFPIAAGVTKTAAVAGGIAGAVLTGPI